MATDETLAAAARQLRSTLDKLASGITGPDLAATLALWRSQSAEFDHLLARQVEASSGHEDRILIVDDAASFRTMLSLMLRPDWRPRVVEAADADEALRMMESERFALALVDLHLETERSGVDLIARIKSMTGSSRGAKCVLAMSADRSPKLRAQARDAGAQDWLDKPYDRAAVLEKVESALAGALPAWRDTATLDETASASIRSLGDDGPRFVQLMLDEAEQALEDMRAAAADHDVEAWRGHANALRGGAVGLGASRLVAVVTAALEKSRDPAFNAAELFSSTGEMSARFADELAQARRDIQTELGIELPEAGDNGEFSP